LPRRPDSGKIPGFASICSVVVFICTHYTSMLCHSIL
jgi:hypothetical protein